MGHEQHLPHFLFPLGLYLASSVIFAGGLPRLPNFLPDLPPSGPLTGTGQLTRSMGLTNGKLLP